VAEISDHFRIQAVRLIPSQLALDIFLDLGGIHHTDLVTALDEKFR
jgi:hypothetical protein